MSADRAPRLQTFPDKPRIFILSDISNEPDDAESLVRYLTYANQFQTEGLVATTSIWLKDRTHPEDMHKIIDGYDGAVQNLNLHTHPDYLYPSADSLRHLVKPGACVYGMAAIGDDIPLSEGGQLLKERIEISPTLKKPLWVLCWSGTNVLGQVLYQLRQEHGSAKAASLRALVRVYAISDQDNTSAWIRTEFPDLFYISSIHAWNQYGLATWVGISGENLYNFDDGGPDGTKVSKEWLKNNIQIGALGSKYPDPMYIPEGDTPSFLYLIQNGLSCSEEPNFGSWGGRYSKTDPENNINHYSDTSDRVEGANGKMFQSNHATIWRWRDAYQNDFAARIQWSMLDGFSKANHHPVVSVNGHGGLTPLRLDLEIGSSLKLDASDTYDPDGDELSFRWFQYDEPSLEIWHAHTRSGKLAIKSLSPDSKIVEVQLPSTEKCVKIGTCEPSTRLQVLHLILEVKDTGSPPLVTYKRILIQSIRLKI